MFYLQHIASQNNKVYAHHSKSTKQFNFLLRNFLDFYPPHLYQYPWEYQLGSITMKKIILLSTAAMLLSPIAAKANQKSSILVGLKGVWERKVGGDSNIGGEDILKAYEGENFISGGIETYYTYKAWKSLQISAGAEFTFSPEHEFQAASQTVLGNKAAPYSLGLAPRFNIGWTFASANNLEITPYVGFGLEFNFAEQTKAADKKEWASEFKMPVFAGVRVNYSYFYASLAGRIDATSTDLMEGRAADAKADARFAGVELSIGSEF